MTLKITLLGIYPVPRSQPGYFDSRDGCLGTQLALGTREVAPPLIMSLAVRQGATCGNSVLSILSLLREDLPYTPHA